MIRGIDHLVIACADPDAAAEELGAQLGLAVTGGGRHAGRGTWNRIAWLADGSYLELIGVDDAGLARANPVGAAAVRIIEEHGGGLATYALLDDDVETAAAALGALGSFGPVEHGSRARPDGELVEWWTSFPLEPLAASSAPFLIQHAYAGAEWGPDAMAARAALRHPLGSPVSLVRLDIASDDPPGSAGTIHDQLGLDFWAVSDLAVADLGRHVLRLVPTREMPTPAVVTLAADLEAPVTVTALGLRFDVERAAVTSGTG
ncbi:MAG: VOC family protein [Chloroflexi bacterium]|nr:VOC family protein [Chloroflexota bacterium]